MIEQMDMKGYGFTASHEACYLFAYPDPGTKGDPWTIGIGHTRHAGQPAPRPGDFISLPQVLAIYVRDMARYSKDVVAAVGGWIRTQAQFNALVSFHFNTGAIRSGSVDEKIRRGDLAGAMQTLLLYNKAGGRVMKGLVNRRQEEKRLFETGVYPLRKILLYERPGARPSQIAVENLPWPDKNVRLDLDIPILHETPAKEKKDENFILDLFRYVIGLLNGEKC